MSSKLKFTGSICLTDVPREVIKVVETKEKDANGNPIKKMFLNIAVFEMERVGKYGDTHCISCAPKKEERKDNVNYLCGKLKPWVEKNSVSPEEIAAAPSASPEEHMPWDNEDGTVF